MSFRWLSPSNQSIVVSQSVVTFSLLEYGILDDLYPSLAGTFTPYEVFDEVYRTVQVPAPKPRYSFLQAEHEEALVLSAPRS